MADDYSSIGPLDATAQKEGISLIGLIALAMVVTIVGLYIVGMVLNSIL
jgi:hypothetical protein